MLARSDIIQYVISIRANAYVCAYLYVMTYARECNG